MDTTVKLYVLIDPRDNSIRYLGRTSKENVEYRLMEHISKSKFHKRYKRPATHLTNWINSLLTLNLKPLIKEIEVVIGWEESHKREKELILEYSKEHNLTNHMDKGPGPYHNLISKEQRKQISETLKKNYKNGMPNKGYESLRKSVYQFNLDGTFVQKFDSIAKAAHALNMSTTEISYICHESYEHHTAKGFAFSFNNVFPEHALINNHTKAVNIFNVETKRILYFKSVTECCKTLRIPQTCFHRLKKDFNKQYKKYKIYDEKRDTDISSK